MISIIIPVYNVEKYLDECLHSVFKQTYKDWECILVDDGSSDNSGIICDKWNKIDSRFICIHQINQGVSVARNIGLKKAKGEYVIFVDSDDFIEQDYLFNLKKNISCKNIDIVISGIAKIYKNGIKESTTPTCNITIEMSNIYSNIFLKNIGLFYGPTSKIYKKAIINKYSIHFPKDLSLGEDIIFNFTYLAHCRKIKLIKSVDYNYRQLENGLCNKYRIDLFECLFYIWNFRIEILKQKKMWNKNLARYFSIQLWGYTYNCLFNKIPQSYSTIKKILNTVDVRILNDFKEDFTCAKWIKFCFLYRLAIPIFLITHKK